MPRAPSLYMLSVEPNPVLQGEQVTVKWQADPLSKVRITVGSVENILPAGSNQQEFTAGAPDTYKVTAVAMRDGKESEPKTVEFKVASPPPSPKPEILKFSIAPKVLTKGGTGIVTYEFSDGVKKARLDPIGLDLEITGNSKTFPTPDVSAPSFVKFTIVAEGDGNAKPAKSTLKIQVIEASLASIVKFDAYPAELSAPGDVTLSWQLSNAVRAEIGTGQGAPMEVDPNKGTQVFPISKTTVFTLIGTDQKGIAVTRKLTVKVSPAAPPPDITPPSDPGALPPK